MDSFLYNKCKIITNLQKIVSFHRFLWGTECKDVQESRASCAGLYAANKKKTAITSTNSRSLIGWEGLRKIATPVRRAIIQKHSEFGSHNPLGAGHVARIGIQEMHTIFRCHSLRDKRKYRTRWGYIYWIQLAQDKVRFRDSMTMVMVLNS
jgi:hypothetical protein